MTAVLGEVKFSMDKRKDNSLNQTKYKGGGDQGTREREDCAGMRDGY